MLIKQINNNCYVRLDWNTTTDAYYNRVQFNFDWTVVCVNKQEDLKIESLGTVELYCATASSMNSIEGTGNTAIVDPIAAFTENGFFINTRDLNPGEYSAVMNDRINLPFGWMFASNIQGQFLSPVEIKWSGLEVYVGGELATDVDAVASENTPASVYRLVETSFPTTYIEDTAAISLTRGAGYSALPIDLSYTIGENTFDMVYNSNARDYYNWTVPTSLRNYAEEGAVFSEIYITCKTYDRFNNLIGETRTAGIVLLDRSIAPAEIRNVEISLTDSQYSHLTGTYDVGIKYFSDFWVSFIFIPATGATVASKKIITESGKVIDMTRASSVKMVDVSDNYIDIVCEDSFGFRAEERRYFPLIDYFKPICSVTSSEISPDGRATLEVTGSFFNQNFGIQANNLTLRYFIAPASYGDVFGGDDSYITNITYLAGNSFTATVELSGLNYESTYNCQVWAEDRITTYNSNIITIGGKSLFNWGKEDFEFNIQVNANENVNLAVGKAITGTDTTGNIVEAMVPCDGAGYTTIGFGSFNDETGGTNVYGNTLNLFAHENATLNGQSLIGLINALTNQYSFSVTSAPGTGFNTVSMALTLRGNCLYCRVYGSRGETSGTGDFTDVLLGTFSFEHGGKIKSMDYIDAVTGGSGPTAALTMKNVSVDTDTASFEVYLTSSSSAARNFMANFVIPVTIDVNHFV